MVDGGVESRLEGSCLERSISMFMPSTHDWGVKRLLGVGGALPVVLGLQEE